MDVGASTVDVGMFIAHDVEGVDRYELLATDVMHAGCSEFTRFQASQIAGGIARAIEGHGLGNYGMSQMPTEIEQLLPAQDQIMVTARQLFEDGISEFVSKWAGKVGKLLSATKKDRDPRAPAWSNSLPTFVCGGGSSVHVYSQILTRCQTNLTGMGWRWQGLQKRSLPQPGAGC
jgi:hypothetical protein